MSLSLFSISSYSHTPAPHVCVCVCLCVCVCVRSHKCLPLFEPFDNNNDSGKDYHSWPLLNFKVKGALQLWLCVYQRKANDELISYGLRLLSPHLSEDLSHPLSGRMLSVIKKREALVLYVMCLI